MCCRDKRTCVLSAGDTVSPQFQHGAEAGHLCPYQQLVSLWYAESKSVRQPPFGKVVKLSGEVLELKGQQSIILFRALQKVSLVESETWCHTV